MQLKKTLLNGLLLFSLVSCSDDTVDIDAGWAVGSYSSVPVEAASLDLLNVEVYEDGRVSFTRWTSCTGDDKFTEDFYEWKADGTERILITDPSGGLVEGEPQLWLAKTEACDRVMLQAASGEGTSDFLLLHVGATCLVYDGPCDPGSGECAECVAQWCDGAPVSCE